MSSIFNLYKTGKFVANLKVISFINKIPLGHKIPVNSDNDKMIHASITLPFRAPGASLENDVSPTNSTQRLNFPLEMT